MKIGVITYHKELSHGATFQAYATYRALRELGCDVEVVDLKHSNKSPRPKWQVILRNVYMSLAFIRQELFRRKFYPHFSRHYSNLAELRKNPPKVDALCVGSDQTWNIKIATEENMPAFFLDFGPYNLPRFSYAPSFGFPKWQIDDPDESRKIGALLKQYVGLSVREVTGQKILKEQFGLNAKLVCDPTILHSHYDEFTKGLKLRNEVLCYSLSVSRGPKIKAMKDISAYLGAPIRWMGKPFFVNGTKYTYFPDAYKWFRLIASAKFILTDSFHGTVASLLCHKPFAVLYEENGLSSRIVDLLAIVGLKDRIFFSYDDFAKSDTWKQEIDYKEVDSRLKVYRDSSWDYLRDVIKRANLLAKHNKAK